MMSQVRAREADDATTRRDGLVRIRKAASRAASAASRERSAYALAELARSKLAEIDADDLTTEEELRRAIRETSERDRVASAEMANLKRAREGLLSAVISMPYCSSVVLASGVVSGVERPSARVVDDAIRRDVLA